MVHITPENEENGLKQGYDDQKLDAGTGHTAHHLRAARIGPKTL
jgi:hypothetical protein